MLSPCPHGTGQEAAIASRYPEVDRVQSSEHFFSFLLWGKTAEKWDWREQGIVLFLGGDQFYPLILGKRLGYRTLIYAEWEARWYRWIDHFCVMNASVIDPIPQPQRHKLTVVGDLMADLTPLTDYNLSEAPIIGLLPGSKPGKLTQGVPLCLAIAQAIIDQKPQARFILPVAPTLEINTLATFADPQKNPFVSQFGGISAELVIPSADTNLPPILQTNQGLSVELIPQFPAHEHLRQCALALTTVGANTAELGALGIPMIVLLPTQQLDAMRTWDGIPGILANLPTVGRYFAQFINAQIIKQDRLFAWPNIWANEKIVPELVGELQPHQVANLVLSWLETPTQLEQIRHRLLQVRGQPGAAIKIAKIVHRTINP